MVRSYPSLALAALLSILVLGASSLPPIELVQRADLLLFDLWSRAAPPDAPEDIVILNLDDPAWQQTLSAVADANKARLLVSTLAQPPTFNVGGYILGPVAIASPGSNMLRETAWTRGGYLWPQLGIDGTVRNQLPMIDNRLPVPSLALAASIALQRPQQSAIAGHEVVAYSQPLSVDADGRRWLRFFARESFQSVSREQILAAPGQLESKIVIMGAENGPRIDTSLGPMTTQELLAQQLAGYWLGISVEVGTSSYALTWGIAALFLLALAAVPLAPAWSATIPILGSVALTAGSFAAFVSGGQWYPIAGPALLALLTGTSMALSGRRLGRKSAAMTDEPVLQRARRLVARGSAVDAWKIYERHGIEASVLPEVYALGTALDLQGEGTVALSIFQQISAVDPQFADVSERLNPTLANPKATTDKKTIPSLGRYQLIRKIGQGAMGVVYLGKDPKINRLLAIKTIDLAAEFELEDLDEVKDRFLMEAETAGRLSHPNIVTIYDAGEESNLAYIAMELLQGQHLSNYTQPERLLPVATTLELLARAAKAVGYAHRHNIVHRDIKPANIMYDSNTDELKLTDFGIARMMDVSRTRTGIVLGTPSYMSPEQLEGENVNGNTDLFSLGVSLYQLLTGHLPFRGTSMTELMFAIANEPHLPVTTIRQDLPSCLNVVLNKALAKRPADRYESGIEMANAFRDAARQAGDLAVVSK